MLFNPYPKFQNFFPKVLDQLCQISSPFLPRHLTSMTNIKSFFSNVLYPPCQISRKVLDQYAKCQVLFFQRTRLVRPTNLMSRMDGKKTHTHTHTLPTMPNFKSFSSKVLDQYAKFQVLFSQRTWPTMPNFKSFSPKELDQYAKFRVLFLETFFFTSPVCRISTHFF